MDGAHELCHIGVLGDVPVCSCGDRAEQRVAVVAGAHDNDLDVVATLLEASRRGETVESAGHGDVEQQHRAGVDAHGLQGLVAGGRLGGYLKTLGLEELRQTGAPQRVVVGDDDADAHARRSTRRDRPSSRSSMSNGFSRNQAFSAPDVARAAAALWSPLITITGSPWRRTVASTPSMPGKR